MSAKRVFTDSDYSATRSDAFPAPQSAMLGDDLVRALQNVGSRVRKNVTEGYTTSRFTTPNTSPDRPQVPSSSPAITTNPSPIRAPVFRSAADTLHDVYSSTSSSGPSNVSPARSAKRNHVEEDEAAEDEDFGMSLPSSQDSIVADAHGRSSRFDSGWVPDDAEDDDTEMGFGDLPTIRPSRVIAPLKRGSKNSAR